MLGGYQSFQKNTGKSVKKTILYIVIAIAVLIGIIVSWRVGISLYKSSLRKQISNLQLQYEKTPFSKTPGR